MQDRTLDIPLTTVTVDRSSPVSLFVQLYRGLRDAIVEGKLAPGVRLPSTRRLAAELGVGRNTVLDVYEQLYAEGYVEGRVGAGTYVVLVAPERARLPLQESTTVSDVSPRSGKLSEYGSAVERLGLRAPARPPSRAFALGMPDVEHFPAEIWRRLTVRRWRGGQHDLLQHGSPAGYRPLREAIATYLGATRGVRCEAEQVIVVAGTQRGLSLATRILLDPGDRIWMEDPGYPGARQVFRTAGLEIAPVPVDPQGLSIAEGTTRAGDARAVYVTPSNQFPLGVTMSAARRLALLEWAYARAVRDPPGFRGHLGVQLPRERHLANPKPVDPQVEGPPLR